MMRHGVLQTINSDSDERVRRLNIDAAKLIKYGGMTEDEALATITINGAKQLGVGNRTGSIEVGKDADIGIWNAHPLSVFASADMTFIDGEVFFDKAQDQAKRSEKDQQRAALERADENRPARGQQRVILP
jgi:imidazolonepropionase-like amidohydrolase